ncbi:MAG: asparaginase [Vulcanimicrobiaceae bacterium]
MQRKGPSGVPFVEVWRGELVESVHAVAACAVDVDGNATIALGDVDVPVYLRSAAKPFIAAAIVAAGAARAFGLESREIAVIAGSHNGEPPHVEAARSILRKAAIDERALRCGAHPPAYEPAAAALAARGLPFSAIHNNCSGKHAGILALAKFLGADLDGYLEPQHPAQALILAFCARLTGDDPTTFPLGVDGCGIPVFASSLRRAARAFARLATLDGGAAADAEALGTVRAAMIAEPFFVGGTERFDSALIAATGGRVVGKAGAEGVHGDALVQLGLGLVLKVVDGNRRATPPAAVALLNALNALDDGARAQLAPFAAPELHNVAGRLVGRLTTDRHPLRQEVPI